MNFTPKKYDLILVGGGLANSLVALLALNNPERKIALIERSDRICGNHTWCFHESPLVRKNWNLLRDVISVAWPSQTVKFHSYSREIRSPYYCILGKSLEKALLAKQGSHFDIFTDVSVEGMTETQVRLSNATILEGNHVVDGRGVGQNFESAYPGFQNFFGLKLKLKRPSGLKSPIIMDATVPQTKDGFHFMYVLPFESDEILVEDTFFSNHPNFDSEELEKTILNYCAGRGWEIQSILETEVGCLPMPVRPWSPPTHLLTTGLRGGFFHPTTGYSFGQALEVATLIAETSSGQLVPKFAQFREEFIKSQDYYYLLNKMMFLCAAPESRFKIFERFYKMSEDFIQRFYNRAFTPWDNIRMLSGKPPFGLSRYMAKNLKNFWMNPEKLEVPRGQHYIS